MPLLGADVADGQAQGGAAAEPGGREERLPGCVHRFHEIIVEAVLLLGEGPGKRARKQTREKGEGARSSKPGSASIQERSAAARRTCSRIRSAIPSVPKARSTRRVGLLRGGHPQAGLADESPPARLVADVRVGEGLLVVEGRAVGDAGFIQQPQPGGLDQPEQPGSQHRRGGDTRTRSDLRPAKTLLRPPQTGLEGQAPLLLLPGALPPAGRLVWRSPVGFTGRGGRGSRRFSDWSSSTSRTSSASTRRGSP